MHVLITTDRFTGAGTARRVGSALAAGWLRGAAHDTVELCPLSDGGPGFAGLLAEVCGWPLPDPDGVLVVAGTAYVDAAGALASGPQAGSVAVGAQLIRAVEAGVTRIVVGLGTPADLPALPDAGAGLLAVLGVRGLGVRGADAGEVMGLGEVLDRFRGIDLIAATATDIPLLGLHGASAGAADAGWVSREAAQQREREIGQLADALWRAREHTHVAAADLGGLAGNLLPTTGGRARDLTGLPGAGAGGGLGFALALLGARLLPGAGVYAQTVGLTARAQAADLVVCAREDLDGASFHGSGIEQAALAASGLGVACVALADRSMMNRRELAAVGLSASYPLSSTDPIDSHAAVEAGAEAASDTVAAAVADTVADRVADVAARVARSWSPAWSSSASS